MKYFKIVLLGLFLSIAYSQVEADTNNYGDIWLNKITVENRLFWLDGYSAGQSIVMTEEALKDDTLIEFHLKKADVQVIEKIITEFYKDPANSYISFSFLVAIANMKLKGATEKEVKEKLELMRGYFSSLSK